MGGAIIIMGSSKDIDYSKKIASYLEKFKIPYKMRVASAHKTPLKVLKILEENKEEEVVFITVAGKSNALSGFVDANTIKPVIAAPPYSERWAGADIFSSLSMPSGVAPVVVIGAEQAAIACAKILALKDEKLKKKIEEYQKNKKEEINKFDSEIYNG